MFFNSFIIISESEIEKSWIEKKASLPFCFNFMFLKNCLWVKHTRCTHIYKYIEYKYYKQITWKDIKQKSHQILKKERKKGIKKNSGEVTFLYYLFISF